MDYVRTSLGFEVCSQTSTKILVDHLELSKILRAKIELLSIMLSIQTKLVDDV